MKTLQKDLYRYYAVRSLLKRFVLPVLPLYMLDIGLSVTQIGLIAATAYIISLLLEVPSGMVSDTLGHKRTLVVSLLGQAVSMALYLGGSFWWVLAGSAMYFGSGAFMSGTISALLYERLDEENQSHRYHHVFSRAKAVGHLYSMITLLFTGLAYAWQWWLPFVIGIVHFCFAAFFAAGFTQAKQTQSVKTQEGFWRFITHFPTAVKQLRKHPVVLWVVLLNGIIVGFGFGSGDFHQVVFHNLGLAVVLFGVAYSIKRLAQFIAYATVSRIIERTSIVTFLGINAALVGGYLLLTPFMHNPWTFVLSATLASAAYGLMSIGVDNYINTNIPSGSRATALSLATFFRALIMAISAGSIGWLAAWFGLEQTFGMFGIALLVIVIAARPWLVSAYRAHRV